MANKLKIALQNRRVTLGTWIQIDHPAVIEILARSGFDWLCIDLEHGPIDMERLANLLRTLAAYDVVPVVRVPLNDEIWIKRSLDAGAMGIIVPMVNTPEQAEQAVNWCKFPPEGKRSFGYSRINAYGENFMDYVVSANKEISVIVQIEHKAGIQQLPDILKTEGLDAAFIGPYDLSGSYGVPGDLGNKEVAEALKYYREQCAEKHITAGMHIVRPDKESLAQAKNEGYTMIALGIDTYFLQEGSRAVLQDA